MKRFVDPDQIEQWDNLLFQRMHELHAQAPLNQGVGLYQHIVCADQLRVLFDQLSPNDASDTCASSALSITAINAEVSTKTFTPPTSS